MSTKGDKSSRSSDEHVAATIELIDLLNKRHATIHDPRAQHGPGWDKAIKIADFLKMYKPEVVPGKAIKIADFQTAQT
ncbi:hypothetical protein MY8738_009959 [Beauveria namnaoensis]